MATIKTKLIIRNDSTLNWNANSTTVLLKGEMGLEFTDSNEIKLKIGDGTSTWADLPYWGGSGKVFENDDISKVTTDNLAVGDIAVIKKAIYTDSTDASNNKYEYTGYVWNGTAWAAMDGNYSAANVFLPENITLAGNYTSIGNYNKGKVINAGTSLQDMFSGMLSQRLQPATPTQPAVSITFNSGAKEVGTKITPTYTASLSAGSYTYGPATGITAKTWSVVAKNGTTTVDTKTTASGSFDEITVEEGTNYKVTASATHDAGPVAKDNLGSNSNPEVKIAAGTKSKDSAAITGYRSWFYGYKNADGVLDVANLTSANIRGLTATNGSIPGSLTTNKMQQMFFAIPKGKKNNVAVANATNGAPQTVTKATNIMVEGANSYTAAAYDVWYVSNATAESGSTKFNITVS